MRRAMAGGKGRGSGYKPPKMPKPPTPFIRDLAAEQRIRPFIEARRVIQFVSKGKTRTVEPFLLGYNHAGNLELSAWQLTGGSGQGWRGFLVREPSGIAATPATFAGSRPGYNPNDSQMQLIVCRV